MLAQGKLWMAVTIAGNSTGSLGKNYYDTVIDLNPEAYYRLGESSGATTATDEMGNYNGTYDGGTTLEQPSLLLGKDDTSVLFDGSTGQVNLPYSYNTLGTGDFTQVYLIKRLSGAGAINYWWSSSGTEYIALFSYSDGRVWAGFRKSGSADVSLTTTLTLNLSEINHLVFKRENGDISIYINGVKDTNTLTVNYNFSATLPMVLMGRADSDASYKLHGVLDEAQLYNRALSQSEIMTLYNASKHIKYNITIDHTKIGEDLYNFPLLINLDTNSGINSYDTTNIFDFPNTSKIILKHSNSQFQYTEIDRFDSINKSAQLWTKVPYISSTVDTDIELICDLNSTVNGYTGFTGTSAAKKAWDNNFIAVYHLSNEPTGGTDSYINSTVYSRPMTPINLDATNLVDADIGKAISFNGIDERFYINNLTNVPATNTIEAVHSADDRDQLVSNSTVFECRAHTTVNEWMATLTVSGYPKFNDLGEYTTSGFYKYVAGSNDGTGNTVTFEQGILKNTKTGQSTSTADSIAQLANRRLNSGTVSTDGWLKGNISEIRVSNIKRSDSYILSSSYSFEDSLIGVNTTFNSSYQSYLTSLSPNYYFKLNNNGHESITNIDFTISKYGTKLQGKSLLSNSRSNSIFFKNEKGLYYNSNIQTDSYPNKTIIFLAKFKDLNSTQMIFKEGGTANGWGIGIVNGIGFRIGTMESSTGNYADLSTTGYNTDQVYHFVGIIDTNNNKIQLYIDNTLVIDVTTTIGTHNGTADPAIGTTWTNSDSQYQSPLTGSLINEPFYGYLSDVAIFNRVLTTTEIANLYAKI